MTAADIVPSLCAPSPRRGRLHYVNERDVETWGRSGGLVAACWCVWFAPLTRCGCPGRDLVLQRPERWCGVSSRAASRRECAAQTLRSLGARLGSLAAGNAPQREELWRPT